MLVVILLCTVAWVLLDINGRNNRPAVNVITKPAGEMALDEVKKSYQPPEAARASTKFFVQLGAFADETSAREVFEQMTAEGFAPTLAAPDENYELFRIFVGPFDSAHQAEEIAQRLNELDFHCFVIESL